MTETLCVYPKLTSEFYQTVSLPGAAVDMVYWCSDCGRYFTELPNAAAAVAAAAAPNTDDRWIMDAKDLPF